MDRVILSDERLMALARSGDEPAFQSLVRRTGPSILTLAMRMTGHRTAAEEAFVDAVAQVWLGRSTYQVGRPVRPWLMAIVANVCRARLRRIYAGRGPHFFTPRPGGPDAGAAPELGLAAGERAARVHAALAELPDRQREVLVMRVWGGLEYGTIAEVLGVTEGTARSTMHHALAALRRLLGPGEDWSAEVAPARGAGITMEDGR